jgi:5-methylcytosine-specific restriction endonuclease McrA
MSEKLPRAERRKNAREKWVLQNPEKNSAAKSRWRSENRESIRKKAREAYARAHTPKAVATVEQAVAERELRLYKKRIAQALYVVQNPEKVAQTRRATMQKHRVARNADKAEWRRKNPGKVLALTRKRQLAKIQRTPPWLTEDDFWLMSQAYELAALRTRLFGFAWHVDHIIPLQGELVSGMHVPTNLQVIPGSENSRKGSRYDG